LFSVTASVLKGVGWEAHPPAWLAPLAWGLAAAASFRLILLRPARREVELSDKRRALVFRSVYLWGKPREREQRKPDVAAVALLAREHGGPYLQLKLVLADGGLLFVEQGKEMERMRELARDVGKALGLPVSFLPAVAGRGNRTPPTWPGINRRFPKSSCQTYKSLSWSLKKPAPPSSTASLKGGTWRTGNMS
jgi:hypothetical protein